VRRPDGDCDRVEKKWADRHRLACTGVEALDLGVGAKAARGDVDRPDLGLDDRYRGVELAGDRGSNCRDSAERLEAEAGRCRAQWERTWR
jgi:hypothetical protein